MNRIYLVNFNSIYPYPSNPGEFCQVIANIFTAGTGGLVVNQVVSGFVCFAKLSYSFIN